MGADAYRQLAEVRRYWLTTVRLDGRPGARSFATMRGLSTDLTKPQLCATCDFVKSLAKALLGKG